MTMSTSIQIQGTTVHPSSHDAEDDGEESWDGYPLGPETTLRKKLCVTQSGSRDQTPDEASDPDMPRPVSTRTRNRTRKEKHVVKHRDESDGDSSVDEDRREEDVEDGGAGVTR